MAENNANIPGLPENNPIFTGTIPKTFFCIICKDNNLSPNLSVTKCGHKYHRSCINTYLQSHHKCPFENCQAELHYSDLTKIRKNKKIDYGKNTERVLRSHRMYKPNTIMYEDVNTTNLMLELREAEKTIEALRNGQKDTLSEPQNLNSVQIPPDDNNISVQSVENHNLNSTSQNIPVTINPIPTTFPNLNFPPLNTNNRPNFNSSNNSEYRTLPNSNNNIPTQLNSSNQNNSTATINTVENFINSVQTRYLNSNSNSQNQINNPTSHIPTSVNLNLNSVNPNLNNNISNNPVSNFSNQNFNAQNNRNIPNSNSHFNSSIHNNSNLIHSNSHNSNLNSNLQNANTNFPNSQNNNSNPNPSLNNNVSIDQISQMIESSVERILSRLSLNNNVNSNPLLVNNNSPSNSNFHTPQIPIASNLNTNNNNFPDLSIASSNFHTSSYQIRVTNILQSWNIKFDGSDTGLSVEEFIYRIKSLTADYLNNDFHLLSKHLHILLNGKARDWYWRYRKQVANLNWNNLCTELRYQYKDFKTASDIKQQIRTRKQREGESFQIFFDDIIRMSDRLPIPLEEEELIEIVSRNLLPEIRKEMLYVNIISINQLRKLCFMRENLLQEEKEIRRSQQFSRTNQNVRRNVYAIDCVEDVGNVDNVDSEEFNCSSRQETNTDMQVSAINNVPRKLICANCDKEGHHWQNCLAERRVFCYGCLAKNVYKPQCPKCNPKRSENSTQGAFNATKMYPKNN